MRKSSTLLFGAITLLAFIGTASAQDTDKPGDELIVYTGTGIPTDFADAMVEPFADYMEEKYGVRVNVRTVPGQIPTVWATLQTEWPNPTGDVYWLYNQLIRDGIAEGWWIRLQDHYTPEEWALFDAAAMKTLNTDGYSAPIEVAAWVLAVQDSLAPDAVTSLADFGKDELKGRITFDSALSVGSGYNALLSAALIRGDDWNDWFKDGKFDPEAARPTFELVASWAENALTLTQGSGSIRPLLQRGEALASAWWWHNTIEEVESGTAVRVVAPSEGVVAVLQSGPVISSQTDNPIAAVEWVKFVHSDGGNVAAQKVGYRNKLPRAGESATPEWTAFLESAKMVYSDEFRDTLLSPAYNQQVLELYTQIVIEGR